MIDLATLIQVAPYPDDARSKLFEKLDSLSNVQKQELEKLSWELIVEEFESKISLDSQTALSQMALGEKKAEEIDLEKIEENYFNDLTTRLSSEDAKGKIDEIRNKLHSESSN